MTTTEARNNINTKFNSGLISREEATKAHNAISNINTGYRYGSRISWNQQAKLRAVWA